MELDCASLQLQADDPCTLALAIEHFPQRMLALAGVLPIPSPRFERVLEMRRSDRLAPDLPLFRNPNSSR
jgi:hypothetical protein